MLSEEEILAIEADLEKDLEQLNEDYIRGSSPSNSSRLSESCDEIEKSLQLELCKEQNGQEW